jgi:hypothetical protein
LNEEIIDVEIGREISHINARQFSMVGRKRQVEELIWVGRQQLDRVAGNTQDGLLALPLEPDVTEPYPPSSQRSGLHLDGPPTKLRLVDLAERPRTDDLRKAIPHARDALVDPVQHIGIGPEEVHGAKDVKVLMKLAEYQAGFAGSSRPT